MGYEIKKITDFEVGMKNSVVKTITQTDVTLFGAVSHDLNPLHFDYEYAKTTMFGGPIVHGQLTASLLSAAGAQLTGQGSIYVKDERFFAAPVRVGDTITATAEVLDIDAGKKNMHLKMTCTNQRGEVVVEGKATVKFIV